MIETIVKYDSCNLLARLSVNNVTIWVSVNGSIRLRLRGCDHMEISLMSSSLSASQSHISEQFLDTSNNLMIGLDCSEVYQYVGRKVLFGRKIGRDNKKDSRT
eukprot:TRINITY_DN3329_c0_g6_i1.p3 TRINITY_DN3329_c0_g6~~TRINITY_DN3329_c0_g6_i1.p3  ORF type:complete len:103 (+),score=6.01 TRINITY_DN3329_c0_g6_i1:717-1025(+)